MKSLTYFLCFFFTINLAHSQSIKPFEINVLKSSKKIDSLMRLIIVDEKNYLPKDESLLKDSCWRVELRSLKEYISFQISQMNGRSANDLVNKFYSRTGTFGIYRFMGYKIIVWSEDNYHNFFEKTVQQTTVPFIFGTNDGQRNLEKALGLFHTSHYKFDHGAFSPEGPPPVM